jgi:hypothetical protein
MNPGVLFALADRIEARLATAQRQVWPDEALRRRLDALTPSLPPSPRLRRTGLTRAFAGRLVPQPGYFLTRRLPQPKVEDPAPSGPGNRTSAVTAHRPPG